MSTHSKPLLVVTNSTPLAALPPEVAERVNRDFVVRLAETPESLTSDGLVELSDGASGFLVTPFDRIDASFFDRVAASVKIVATRSVGYDHIDIAAAACRHIPVGYAPASEPTPQPTRQSCCCSARRVVPTRPSSFSAPASCHRARRWRLWAGS